MNSNVYLPEPAKIIRIKEEVQGQRAIKSFRTQFLNGNQFSYQCGQCAMLSVFGKGESMISISSAPYMQDYLQFSILRTGRVTTALHEMEEGDVIGIRGPFGNGFPLQEWKGRNLTFIGGGIGQSRTYMYFLRTAHLGEVSVTVWPDKLKEICAKKNINVLE